MTEEDQQPEQNTHGIQKRRYPIPRFAQHITACYDERRRKFGQDFAPTATQKSCKLRKNEIDFLKAVVVQPFWTPPGHLSASSD
jgi:hypothetical protein